MAFDFSSLRVLIVDDNPFMRRLLREVLVALNFHPDRAWFAADGEDALRAMRDRRFDLIICDINMKPMDGKQFTKHVRMDSESEDPYVPIIICTGHAEIEHIREARDAGASEVLRKPITVRNLYERIRSIVEKPRPFIRSDDYHGPDRRRQDLPFKGPDRRNNSPVKV
jgi:CheY-like chemotaxis protein